MKKQFDIYVPDIEKYLRVRAKMVNILINRKIYFSDISLHILKRIDDDYLPQPRVIDLKNGLITK